MNKRLVIMVGAGVLLLLLGAVVLQNLAQQAAAPPPALETSSTPEPVASSVQPVAVSVPEGVVFDPVYADEDIKFWHPDVWKSTINNCGEFGCVITFTDTNNVEVLIISKSSSTDPETQQLRSISNYVETFMSPSEIIKEQSSNGLTLYFLRDDNRLFLFQLPAKRKIVIVSFPETTDRSVIDAVIRSLAPAGA